MPEVTCVSEVECEVVVPEGILETRVVKVLDPEGRYHMLRVAKGVLVEQDHRRYLPVGLMHVDFKNKRALVELPQEADSGTSRVWISFARFRRQENGR
jgi:uncharacterized protein (DUF342 family)